MKKWLLLIFILSALVTEAQKTEQEQVMKTINRMFSAMKANDSTLLATCFTESPNMFTASTDNQGKSRLVSGEFQRFLAAVGTPKEQVWYEPIWNEDVRIDGNLASVWVDYAFYVDEELSHCGVDAFHLIKKKSGWKIFHLVDTRRKQPCEVPKDLIP